MEQLSPKLSCPSCRGTKLVAGKFLDASKLAPSWMLPKSTGWTYSMTYFVCRDCGYLGLCLTEKERAELDARTTDA
jgi:rubredoxin